MDKTIANFTGNPPPEPQWYFLGLIVILIIACIFCNSIIVAVFIVEKSTRNQANMFVVSLACADLVVAMISMPLWIASSKPGLELHYYHNSVDILCCSASIFNCALLSIERAMKISFPYWYANNVTSFRIKIVILLGWIAAVLVGSLSLLRGTNPDNIPYIIFISIIIYILPVLAIFFSYMSIFLVAHKHVKSIRRQKRRLSSETTRMRMSEAKTAWRLSVFIIVFIICWTPLFVKIWGNILLRGGPPVYFNVLANTLSNVNAVVNPFLYALFNPLFRKGMAKLYKKKKGISHKMESRRNELSTAHTNLNNSPSTSRAVSTHCSPQTERHQPHFTPADLWKDQLDACKTLLTTPHAEHEYTNNGDDKNNYHLYETSL